MPTFQSLIVSTVGVIITLRVIITVGVGVTVGVLITVGVGDTVGDVLSYTRLHTNQSVMMPYKGKECTTFTHKISGIIRSVAVVTAHHHCHCIPPGHYRYGTILPEWLGKGHSSRTLHPPTCNGSAHWSTVFVSLWGSVPAAARHMTATVQGPNYLSHSYTEL